MDDRAGDDVNSAEHGELHRHRPPSAASHELRRRLFPGIAGLAGGYLVRASLVVAGVGAVLAQSPSAMQFLTYLGASYLLQRLTSTLVMKEVVADRGLPLSAR